MGRSGGTGEILIHAFHQESAGSGGKYGKVRGSTGRYGKYGSAISIISSQKEHMFIQDLSEKYQVRMYVRLYVYMSVCLFDCLSVSPSAHFVPNIYPKTSA